MSVSTEAREAYRAYQDIHHRFEAGDMDVTEGDVDSAYRHYLDVHRQHDAPQGYEHYSPYSLSTA